MGSRNGEKTFVATSAVGSRKTVNRREVEAIQCASAGSHRLPMQHGRIVEPAGECCMERKMLFQNNIRQGRRLPAWTWIRQPNLLENLMIDSRIPWDNGLEFAILRPRSGSSRGVSAPSASLLCFS